MATISTHPDYINRIKEQLTQMKLSFGSSAIEVKMIKLCEAERLLGRSVNDLQR